MAKRLPVLTRQQQNALLIRPIVEIETDKRRLFVGLGINPDLIDTQYLALQLIDYIAERNATDEGARREDIYENCGQVVLDMAPEAAEADVKAVIRKILNRLVNAANKRSKFVFTYFDSEQRIFREHSFWLVEYKQNRVHEPYAYYVTVEAMTLFASMLSVNLMLQQEAHDAMIARLLEKGRIEESVVMAQGARQISRDLSFFLRQKILLIQRNPRHGQWVDEVTPSITEARQHISGRLDEEAAILRQIAVVMETSEGEKLERLVQLKEIVQECRNRHNDLYTSVLHTLDAFLAHQLAALRTVRPSALPDLETQILPELMTRPLKDLFRMSEEVGHVFSAVESPKILDLLALFESLLEAQEREQGRPAEAEQWEQVDVEPLYRDRFAMERQNFIQGKVMHILNAKGKTSILDVLMVLESDGELQDDDLLCAIFKMDCAFSDPDIFKGLASPDGDFTHRLASGSNVLLRGLRHDTGEDAGGV